MSVNGIVESHSLCVCTREADMAAMRAEAAAVGRISGDSGESSLLRDVMSDNTALKHKVLEMSSEVVRVTALLEDVTLTAQVGAGVTSAVYTVGSAQTA